MWNMWKKCGKNPQNVVEQFGEYVKMVVDVSFVSSKEQYL